MPAIRRSVIDTSVVIKWIRQEEVLAEQALALRKAYLDGELAITLPSLVAYELANVLRYKNELTTEQVQAAVQSLFDMQLDWAAPTPAVIARAIAIARTYDITVYDAAFIALAEKTNAVLVTADERLVNRTGAVSLVSYLGSWRQGDQ